MMPWKAYPLGSSAIKRPTSIHKIKLLFGFLVPKRLAYGWRARARGLSR